MDNFKSGRGQSFIDDGERTMVGVIGFGSYLPLYRIERETIADQHGDYAGGGEVSVPAHDEGVVSLGVGATKNALEHAGVDGDDLDATYAASTSDPFDERGIAAHVAHAVGAEGDVRVADLQGSARAATSAVLSAMDAIDAGRAETALVVATDARRADAGSSAEQTAGAGAAALVLGAEGDVASIEGSATNTTGFVGRFQRSGGSPVPGDGRFNRERYVEAVAGALDRLGGHDDRADHAALAAPDGRWGSRALSTADVDAEQHSTFDAIGDAGAASVLLDAVYALEHSTSGETVVVASFGPGGSDALVLERGEAANPEMTTDDYLQSKEYVTYAKHRSYRDAGGEA